MVSHATLSYYSVPPRYSVTYVFFKRPKSRLSFFVDQQQGKAMVFIGDPIKDERSVCALTQYRDDQQYYQLGLCAL
jgi:hypothetical protein